MQFTPQQLSFISRNNVKKHIRKLFVSGVITTDPFKILNEQKSFFQNLYKSTFTENDNKSGDDFLRQLNIPKLSEEQKQSCQGAISLEEAKATLALFKLIDHLVMMEYQLNFTNHVGTLLAILS